MTTERKTSILAPEYKHTNITHHSKHFKASAKHISVL